jgi:molybdopterin/thiamine biosynthesis adenylyltransferase
MTGLADRHSGVLDGRLDQFGARTAIVALNIEPGTAGIAPVQHTAWMLVNLLARLADVVSAVHVTGDDAPLLPRITPLAPGANTLRSALLQGGSLIGGVPVGLADGTTPDYELHVGPGRDRAGLRVYGEGYCGAVSCGTIAPVGTSSLPFGPYIAACLAAGEIFRETRLRPDLYEPVTALSFSAWDYTLGSGQLHQVGPSLDALVLDFGLAGVGAVGCALLHALWACPQLAGQAVIADSDPEGVDDTNLNRCVIFGQHDIGKAKATTAAAILADAGITWQPVDGRYARSTIPRVPATLVSAVDTNSSRGHLQQAFWPARLLAASTKDLRAEILRCGPPGDGRCLSCFNPPEVDLPDDVRRAHLRAFPLGDLEAFAAEIGHPVSMVRRWAEEGGCGGVGDAALARMRAGDEPPAMFSVGFVSVMAGTLLAVELIKEHLGRPVPLDDEHQNAKFQFWQPSASRNGRPTTIRRDENCSVCASDSPGVAVWGERWNGYGASQTTSAPQSR